MKKLQYDINKESAKIFTLSSGKYDKYECLTGEEYYLLITASDRTLNLLILHWEKLLKNKRKQLKIREKPCG